MKFPSTLAACACALGLLFGTSASAATVTFEDVGYRPCSAADITSGGLVFRVNDNVQCVSPANEPTPNANNGSSILIEGASMLIVTLPNPGQTFSVSSVDLGTSFFNDTSPNFLLVTGQGSSGIVALELLTVTNQFQTFALSGFNNLLSLSFSELLIPGSEGTSGYFALDNLVVDLPPAQVPAPATLWLALLGLGMLAVVKRQRR